MTASDVIRFLNDVMEGKYKHSPSDKLNQLIFKYPERKDKILNDALESATISANMPFAKHCLNVGADLFLACKRFNPRSNNYHPFPNTPYNKIVIEWLNLLANEEDTKKSIIFKRSLERFCKKTPGCKCSGCTDQDENEFPVDPYSLWNIEKLTTVKSWIAEQQKNSKSTFYKAHRNEFADFSSAVSTYLKYLNRRFN